MEKISRKEAFDCTLALYASIINALNEEKEKLYDYALILLKHSSSPVICLKPGKNFEWNQIEHGENTYAFIPILHNYIAETTLKHCGTDSEYYEGHIPGAILVTDEFIEDEPIPELPDKDQLILVYCRSGNRSKQASEKLAALGYTHIVEFGGINEWPGDVVTE